MIRYKWEPWIDHAWLAVDQNGHIGYFTSVCPEVSPVGVSIPWPYLYNLPEAWIAFCQGVRCDEINRFNLSYDERVAFFADSGLYVWDADGRDACFRLIGKPARPLLIENLHPHFRRIATHFTLADRVFVGASILQGIHFEDKSDPREDFPGITTFDSVRASVGSDLFELIESGKAFTATIKAVDRCGLVGAPSAIGPTFSTWEVVRPHYVKLIAAIASRLQCDEVAVCEMTGQQVCLRLVDMPAYVERLPLPFFWVKIPRQEGGSIQVLMHIEDVVGEVELKSGYYPAYAPDLHVEDWCFEMTADRSPLADRGVKGLVSKVGQFLWPHGPRQYFFKM